jgi:ABC-type Mn2+/Zn2+ transport system permease subunit
MVIIMGIEILTDPLRYDFMVRALITALLSGVMLSILGSFTINKNMGFMADAIAHSTLPIIAIGVFFGFSISELGAPAAIVVALFLGFIIKNSNIGEDTSIGIILISVLDVSINLEDLLFGQILAVSSSDVIVIFILFVTVLAILFVFFKQILFYSFDPIGAQVRDLNVTFLNYLFLIILSLTIVGSLQTVGIVLVLSLLLIPAASAKLVTKTFLNSIKVAAIFGAVSSVSGLYLSYYFNLPSGPTMSLVASSIFILSFTANKFMQKPKLISQ